MRECLKRILYYKKYKLQVKCKNMCQLDPDTAAVTVVIVTFKTSE